jgi:hypothetical protein
MKALPLLARIDGFAKVLVFLEPFGHLQPGNLRQLDVHQDEVRLVGAGEVERLQPVARANRLVAAGFDQVAKELHIELIVFDDHHLLRHSSRPDAAPRIALRKRVYPAKPIPFVFPNAI